MGALNSLATVGLNLALAQQSARRTARDIDNERDRQIQALRQRDEEEQRRQQEALRRRLATQRARAGAAGVASSGGSSDAVLRGLTEEAQAAQSARDQASAERIQDLRRAASRSRRNDLLDVVGSATSSSLGLLGGGSRSRRSLLDF
jgi:hypothetical protein